MIKPAPLDLNRFVRDMERMLSRLIGEHIEFRTVLDENAGFILADHSQMTQVLMNLVTNARDAMPNGGALTIETARVQVSSDSEPHLELEPGDYVRLMVKDTGYGMDRLTQERIFEPFFTTKEQGSGTGLGLCSVYGGVQQNRGRIFVDTELGKGTTFSVYLPSYEVPAAETEVIRSDNPSSGSETILLVEDETALRHMLHEALAKAGYRVWEAGNGAEGLEQWAASRGRIDLLVSDVLMPVMNGLTLARELTSRAPALSVIFMSGHADDVITNQGVLGPGIDLLPKPFLPDVLVQKVREVLDQKRIALLPR
jgi:CheY-like chemotaxis protein